MCELLVRVFDKTNPDCPYHDAQCTKRGDVIAVADDGHRWGGAELTHPDWRIVKVPGVPREAATGFLAPELNDDPANPSRVLQARAFTFDLYANPTDLDSLMAAKTRKPKLQDPNVIG